MRNDQSRHEDFTTTARDANSLRIVSWNLLHGAGATSRDIEHLVHERRPDLLLMQEATIAIDAIAERLGGHYARVPLPGRRHGLACWSPRPFASPPASLPLPSGSFIHRVCQIVHGTGPQGADWSVANVHLSHGQVLNRRQLLVIAGHLPPRAAVLGDFNLVGPVLLPGFRDVGPRDPTHRMAELVPLRIDRCLVRGFTCLAAERLPRSRSDHHPIMVQLRASGSERAGPARLRARAEAWALEMLRDGARKNAIGKNAISKNAIGKNAISKNGHVRDTEAADASPHRAGAPAGGGRPASRG